jgi:hypothetical protein
MRKQAVSNEESGSPAQIGRYAPTSKRERYQRARRQQRGGGQRKILLRCRAALRAPLNPYSFAANQQRHLNLPLKLG